MKLPDAQQSLVMWKKARDSKLKLLLFCSAGVLVGTTMYFSGEPIDALPFKEERKIIVEYAGLIIAVSYVILGVFFIVSMFTKYWEKYCDKWIDRLQNRLDKKEEGQEQSPDS